MNGPDVRDNHSRFAPANEPRGDSLLHRALPPQQILLLIELFAWVGGMWVLQKTHPRFAFLLIPCLLVARGIQWISHRRATRKLYLDVESAGFRRCVLCRHDLSGLSDAGECPECGAAYTLPTLERTWKAIAGAPSRWDDEVFEPLGYWRRLRAVPTSVVYAGLIIFIACAIMLIIGSVGGTAGYRHLLLLLVAAAPPLLWAASTLAQRDALWFLARARFRVCPRCHLSLPRRKAEGVCPNCRLIWDEKWLQETWERVHSAQQAPSGPR